MNIPCGADDAGRCLTMHLSCDDDDALPPAKMTAANKSRHTQGSGLTPGMIDAAAVEERTQMLALPSKELPPSKCTRDVRALLDFDLHLNLSAVPCAKFLIVEADKLQDEEAFFFDSKRYLY